MSNCNCSNCKNNGTQICSVCCSYQGYPDRWEAKPKTNADRIRAMSDEELRDFFVRILWGEEPSIKLYMLPEDWEKWLKQECNE